ncbi:group III truncated hemoglobin [Streptomyces sp. NPDC046876]|uniref:group III truncated hemoglobin n=1 Tax=Streptomyces sp. NPDC046876 TaxID=3155616 RepID=UPI0033F12CBF
MNHFAADDSAADRSAGDRPAGDRDIRGRGDLETVLRRFYAAAFADRRIGPFFTEVAGTDLEAHLPRIADFWERALFRSADYGGDAFAPHAALHSARAMTAEDFGRWVQLWHAALDGLHRGPATERAKAQGEQIALALLRRLAGPDALAEAAHAGRTGFVPLAALELRTPA